MFDVDAHRRGFFKGCSIAARRDADKLGAPKPKDGRDMQMTSEQVGLDGFSIDLDVFSVGFFKKRAVLSLIFSRLRG